MMMKGVSSVVAPLLRPLPRRPLRCCLYGLLFLLSVGVPLALMSLLAVVRLFPNSAAYHRIRSYAGYLGYGWCHPVLPPRVQYSFPAPPQPWKGDGAFWENFACARSEYRVWEPEGSLPAPHPANASSNLLVSAYFDIGRSQWSYFSRSSDQYMRNIATVLTLRNPMVFFTSPDKAEGIVAARRAAGLMDRTMVVAHDLHCASQAWMLPAMLETMCSPETLARLWTFNQGLEIPELQQPWYNVITWMKAGVMRAAASLPHPALASRSVTWLDAGCHYPTCEDSWLRDAYISPAPWARTGRLRVTTIGEQSDEMAQMSPVEWTRRHYTIFMGGAFGATREHIGPLMMTWQDTAHWMLLRGVVGSDQSVLSFMWARHPDLFDPVYTTGGYHNRVSMIVKGYAGLA
jgi:hypothetical protein